MKNIFFVSSYPPDCTCKVTSSIFVIYTYTQQFILCPNGRKKSHCMLVRRAAWSQLCLDVKIGRNVHTACFNGRKCSYFPLQWAKCSYRPKLDCPRLTTHSHATRHGSDVTRVNTALATLGRVQFTLVTIATMPPLVHNLLLDVLDESPPLRKIRSSSHSSHLWWRRDSSMGVGSETTGRANRNRIGAYAPSRESWADWAAAPVRGGILSLPWLVRLVG